MNVHLKSYYVCISLYAGNIAYTIYDLAMFPKVKKADKQIKEQKSSRKQKQKTVFGFEK